MKMFSSEIDIPAGQRMLGQIRFSVPISNIRTPFGEPFGQENHWVKTIEQYKNGCRDFRRSALYDFHQKFQPKSIFSIVQSANRLEECELELGKYPWGRWTSRSGDSEWRKSCHCGPTNDSVIEREWESFFGLYEKIKSEGLNFSRYGHPVGLLFITTSFERYFVVLGGNHRTAIASALGFEKMKVRLLARRYLSCQVVWQHKLRGDAISNAVFKSVISSDFGFPEKM